LTILGDQGYIELRKYIDLDGAAGGEPEGRAARRPPKVELPYGRQLIEDISNRTETAMPQARCFGAAEFALTAQALAERH
jgi:hypothetical protein